ncbi:unnamed protein product, partial [Didymodactylos carnosus]
MSSTNSEHWSDGLLSVVYGINTRVACGIKCTPYEVMFGQKPRSDSDFWRIIKDQNIEDEDMLPVPVEAQQESGESTNDYALIDEALAAANSVLGNEGDDKSQNDDFFPINNQSAPSTPVRKLNNP